VAALLALSPSTDGFAPSALARPRILATGPSSASARTWWTSTHASLPNNYHQDGGDVEEDWQNLQEAASNIARKMGGNILNSLGDSLKEASKQTSNGTGGTPQMEPPQSSIGSRFYQTREEEPLYYSHQSPPSQGYYPGGGQDIHANSFGSTGQSVNPNFGSSFSNPNQHNSNNRNSNPKVGFNDFTGNMGTSVAVIAAIDQATRVLGEDSTAAALLGDFEMGRTLSQSNGMETIRGNAASVVHASFEVEGEYAKGTASVISCDNELVSLDMKVNGQLYKFAVRSPSSGSDYDSHRQEANPYKAASPSYTHHYDNESARTYTPRENNDDVIVEILDEIYNKNKPSSAPNGNVMDAEIVD
jgi:hypothetical protein